MGVYRVPPGDAIAAFPTPCVGVASTRRLT